MTDFAAIKARAASAREFAVTVGDERTFTLRVPTSHEVMLAKRSADGMPRLGDEADKLVLQRLLTHAAIVGWAGLTVGDIAPGQDDATDPLPFELAAIELVLDEQPRWAMLLATELYERIVARTAAATADAKN